MKPSDILSARLRHLHTQAQAAAVIGVAPNTFARWERGLNYPKSKALVAALTAYCAPTPQRE